MFAISYGATPQLQHNVQEKRWVPSGNYNLPSRFRFADDANCGDFTFLFCIGQLRNVQSRRRGLLKVPNILMPAVSWGEKEIWYQVGE